MTLELAGTWPIDSKQMLEWKHSTGLTIWLNFWECIKNSDKVPSYYDGFAQSNTTKYSVLVHASR